MKKLFIIEQGKIYEANYMYGRNVNGNYVFIVYNDERVGAIVPVWQDVSERGDFKQFLECAYEVYKKGEHHDTVSST